MWSLCFLALVYVADSACFSGYQNGWVDPGEECDDYVWGTQVCPDCTVAPGHTCDNDFMLGGDYVDSAIVMLNQCQVVKIAYQSLTELDNGNFLFEYPLVNLAYVISPNAYNEWNAITCDESTPENNELGCECLCSTVGLQMASTPQTFECEPFPQADLAQNIITSLSGASYKVGWTGTISWVHDYSTQWGLQGDYDELYGLKQCECEASDTEHQEPTYPSVCEPIICDQNYGVTNNECVACAAGTIADGADASGPDVSCEVEVCEENEHVVNNACQACASGYERAAGDDATGANTVCTCPDASLCEEEEADLLSMETLEGLSAELLAFGIILPIVVGSCILVLLLWCCCCKRKETIVVVMKDTAK